MKNSLNILRGPLALDFVEQAIAARPDAVVFVADTEHRLEYSFGIDVLKYKQLIRKYIELLSAEKIKTGIETDFRHENILHAGDCGADFVEINTDNYLQYREHYILGIEIANERGIGVVVSGTDTEAFTADMPKNLKFEIHKL